MYNQPNRDRPGDICQYVRKFVNENSVYIIPYIVNGRLNNEYIRGNHYKRVNTRDMVIEDKKSPDSAVYTEKKTFNRILPIYLTRYGILTDNMPIPGFKPSDQSASRVFDATEGNKFIQNYIKDIEYTKLYEKLVQHSDIYGMAWIKTGIDWSMGEDICEVDVEIKDNGIYHDPGETKTGKMMIKEGRPFIDIIPMHEVFVDSLYVEGMEHVNELCHRRPFSLQYIKNRWGIDATPENITDRFLTTFPQYSTLGFNVNELVKYAYVHEYYKKADAVYPKGRYVIVINNQVVYDGVLPYENAANGERVIPFDLVKLQSVPNYLVGVTVYQQLLPIQDTYNSVKNRYLEYVNHIAIGQLYYYEGSLVNKNSFTTKPGKLIGLKRNAKPPTPVRKDRIGVEFINYLKTLEDDMLIAAGLSQLSAYGMSKSNIRTDGVADKVGESDQNKLTIALDNLSKATVSAFKKIMYLEKQRQDILVNQVGLANKDEYIVKYKVDRVDPSQLTIVNREFLMQSDQVLEKKMGQANNLGLYNPQAGLSYLSKLEVLNALKADSLIDTLDPVERSTHDLIEEEHNEMLWLDDPSMIPTAEEWHKHDQHIYEHNIFRISPEIRKMKSEDGDKYKLMMDKLSKHIDEHQKYGKSSQQADAYRNAKDF